MPDEFPRRGAGRPRGFDEGAALEAALGLFWRNGFRATSTRNLEAALGLSQSSLYNAFGSKQDLLNAALDRYESAVEEKLMRPLERDSAGLDAIDRFFARVADWITREGRRGCMLVNLMVEDGGARPEMVERTRSYRKRVRLALLSALQRAVDRDEISDHELASRADLLLGMVLGLNVAARGGASDTEVAGLLAGVSNQARRWRTRTAESGDP
jgi:TetR/AcrR family transcriptional repressor of nem operon